MTPNDYQQAALRTAPGDLPPEKLLLNGLMGLNGEAGEAIDILKKHLFQGHELDTAHIFIGDIVQIANEYGNEGSAYISELVISNSEEGLSIYPTFKTISK